MASSIYQDVDATTNVENIDNSIATDWCAFVVLYVNEQGEVEHYERPSWSAVLVAEQVKDDVTNCLSPLFYTRHKKEESYVKDTGR